MKIFTNNTANQQRIAVLVPVIALALSVFVVYPAWGRYQELQDTVEQKRTALNELKAAPLPQPGAIAPSADDLPTEPPQFLGMVSRFAMEANCEVVGIDMTSTNKLKSEGPISPVKARIDLEGSYGQIRNFLVLLGQAPRMLAITNVVISNKNVETTNSRPNVPPPVGRIHASFEIERYIAPIQKMPPATPAPAGDAPQPKG